MRRFFHINWTFLEKISFLGICMGFFIALNFYLAQQKNPYPFDKNVKIESGVPSIASYQAADSAKAVKD